MEAMERWILAQQSVIWRTAKGMLKSVMGATRTFYRKPIITQEEYNCLLRDCDKLSLIYDPPISRAPRISLADFKELIKETRDEHARHLLSFLWIASARFSDVTDLTGRCIEFHPTKKAFRIRWEGAKEGYLRRKWSNTIIDDTENPIHQYLHQAATEPDALIFPPHICARALVEIKSRGLRVHSIKRSSLSDLAEHLDLLEPANVKMLQAQGRHQDEEQTLEYCADAWHWQHERTKQASRELSQALHA